MNKLFVLFLILTLSACSKETTNISEKYQLPNELSDCKIYRMIAEGGSSLTLVRCPNSSTTTDYTERSGKSTNYRSITVIDNEH